MGEDGIRVWRSMKSVSDGLMIETIQDIIKSIREKIVERFGENLKCLILYGSWARGTAREHSDIDLLAVFARLDKEIRKFLDDVVSPIEKERSITLLSAGLNDFLKEKIPLYTAIKKEGKVIYGNADLTINPEPPEMKYTEFFKVSREFESRKVKIAEEIIDKDRGYGVADLCYVASKHAIQAALAMKGEGYSSKVAVLLPLAEKYFGKEIAEPFRKLFELYIKTEYGVEFLTEEEAKKAVEYARGIQKVYFSG